MSLNYNSNDPYQGGWYKSINPNEHEYTPGYGFSHRSPIAIESALISKYSRAIGLTMISFYVLANLSTIVLSHIFALIPIFVSTKDSVDISMQLIALISGVISLSIPFRFLQKYIKIPTSRCFPMRKISFPMGICCMLITLAVSAVGHHALVTTTLLLDLIGVSFSSYSVEIPNSILGMLLYVINVSFVPAIFEELAFRGVVLQSLRRFGDGFALVCSSLLFAFIHITPNRFPDSFLFGIAAGYFVLFTGSLKTSILLHFAHNFIIVLQIFLLEHLGLEAASNLPLIIDFLYISLGFCALLVMFNRYGGLFEVKIAKTLNDETSKLRIFWTAPAMIIVVVITLLISMIFIV